MTTNDKVRCPSCMGTKKAMRLGMLPGDCGMCKATGFIEKPKDSEQLHTHYEIPQVKQDIKKDETWIETSSIRTTGKNNDKGKKTRR